MTALAVALVVALVVALAACGTTRHYPAIHVPGCGTDETCQSIRHMLGE